MSSSAPALPPAQKLSFAQWMLVVLASIGFLFDIYEILILPLIAEPAMQELIGTEVEKGTEEFTTWAGRLFFIPAIFGGIFGLLGGYLTDRLGRRRVLTYSIALYAVSAFLAGFSTSMWMLLVLRCTTFIGVCVEFVAAVAWLAEMFPNPRQREKVLGYTQAFSSVGGLGAAIVFGLIAGNAALRNWLPGITTPSWLPFEGSVTNSHSAWRYGLMSGAIPAIPLILIRPFLPESPIWKQRRDAGTLKRPSFGQLFTPRYRRATIVATIMFACSYGIAFGALQQTPRIISGVPGPKEEIGKAIKEKVGPIGKKWGVLVQPVKSDDEEALGKLPPELADKIRKLGKDKSYDLLSDPLKKKLGEIEANVPKAELASRIVEMLKAELTKLDEALKKDELATLPPSILGKDLPGFEEPLKSTIDDPKPKKEGEDPPTVQSEVRSFLAKAKGKHVGVVRVRALRSVADPTAANVTKFQEVGGLVGRFLLAVLIVRMASRRFLIRLFFIPALFVILATYQFAAQQGLYFLYVSIFFAGLFTVGQFSFWGNYLPTQYPVHLRGTGSTFAANIGGRVLGTGCAWIAITLAGEVFTPSGAPRPPAEAFAKAAAVTGGTVCVLGFLMSFFLPEPKADVEEDGAPPTSAD